MPYIPALHEAEAAMRKYRTRDPFRIIREEGIVLREVTKFNGLLGFFLIVNQVPFIGINTNVDEEMQRIVAGHELGHYYLDAESLEEGAVLQDLSLFRQANIRKERTANLFSAELLIPDSWVLDRLDYEAYEDMRSEFLRRQERCKSDAARARLQDQLMREFYECHEDMPTVEELAEDNGTVPEMMAFKLQALRYKGYELPNIPEARADFLK